MRRKTVELARRRVKGSLEQVWHEPVSAMYFRKRTVQYAVPDRTSRGRTQDHSAPVKVLGYIGLAVLVVLLAPIALIRQLIDETRELFGKESSEEHGKLEVTGNRANCSALALADAVRAGNRHQWLAWSATHVAVVQAGKRGQPRILWESGEKQSPKIKATGTTLAWPDGSTADFRVSSREQEQIWLASRSRLV